MSWIVVIVDPFALLGAGLGSQDKHLQLTAVRNGNGGIRLARARALPLNSLDNVHALDNLAENDVLAVQPWRLDSADEELAAVGT